MSSKLVIFIALATLAQSSWSQLSTDYGLSEIASTQLRGIIHNQNQTLAANFHSIHTVFDLIKVLSDTRKYNLQIKDVGISSLIAGALLTAKDASDYTFKSISEIRERACNPEEIARTAAHRDLENEYRQIESAVGLAMSVNDSAIRAQFEVYSVESEKSLHNWNTNIFNTIRGCVQTSNPDTLAEIKLHENGSLVGLRRTNNAVFDAIKVFAAGIPAEGDSVAVVPDIKVYRKKALIGVKNSVEQTYSSIRGLYISSQLNRPESAARLTSDQYTQIASDSGYTGGAEVVLDVSKGFLTKVYLGLSDRCNDDSSVIDAAQAESTAYFKSALVTLSKLVSTTDSVITTAATVDSKSLEDAGNRVAGAYFKGIRLAQGHELTYSDALKKIDTIEAELQAYFPDVIRTMFNLVQLGSDAQNRPINVQSNALAAVRSYVETLFAGIRVMAKACHGIEPVSESDFNVLQNATFDTRSILANFNSDLSSSHVSAIKTLYKISTPIVPSVDGVQTLRVRLGVGFTLN